MFPQISLTPVYASIIISATPKSGAWIFYFICQFFGWRTKPRPARYTNWFSSKWWMTRWIIDTLLLRLDSGPLFSQIIRDLFFIFVFCARTVFSWGKAKKNRYAKFIGWICMETEKFCCGPCQGPLLINGVGFQRLFIRWICCPCRQEAELRPRQMQSTFALIKVRFAAYLSYALNVLSLFFLRARLLLLELTFPPHSYNRALNHPIVFLWNHSHGRCSFLSNNLSNDIKYAFEPNINIE